jgi:GNAT superfamily N-acetyltransferase
MPIAIRVMTPSDIPSGVRFQEAAGWNQTRADWERFLDLEPGGCFVAEVDGEAAGTIATCRFGGRCGWLSMLLVPPERRRLGIGSALFRHAVSHLEAHGVQSYKLDATPVGRTVYLQVGFQDEFELQRREGIAPDAAHRGVTRMTPRDLDPVLELDRPLYGADRGRLLARLFEEAERSGGSAYCGVFRNQDGGVDGYAMGRPGRRAAFIGPVLARTEQAGLELFRWAVSRVRGRPVYVDIPLPNPAAVALADEFGFSIQRGFIRMCKGTPVAGDPGKVFATSGPEKG